MSKLLIHGFQYSYWISKSVSLRKLVGQQIPHQICLTHVILLYIWYFCPLNIFLLLLYRSCCVTKMYTCIHSNKKKMATTSQPCCKSYVLIWCSVTLSYKSYVDMMFFVLQAWRRSLRMSSLRSWTLERPLSWTCFTMRTWSSWTWVSPSSSQPCSITSGSGRAWRWNSILYSIMM